MNFTNDMIEKAKTAASADELLKLAISGKAYDEHK